MNDFKVIRSLIKCFDEEGKDSNIPNVKVLEIKNEETRNEKVDILTYLVENLKNKDLNHEYIKYLLSFSNVYDKVKNNEEELTKFYDMENNFMSSLIEVKELDELLNKVKSEIEKLDNY